MNKRRIKILGIPVKPLVTKGTNLNQLIVEGMKKENIHFQNGDIIIITHKIVSKAEGRIVNKGDITVSERAKCISEREGFDKYQVELALRESEEVIRDRRALITVNKSGLVCNFAGIDHSNAPRDSYILLPTNPDESALHIQQEIVASSGKEVVVIITDTEGRPWRKGAVNVAIGCAGINALKYNKRRTDLYGDTLQRSTVCQVDELASAAELVMGQANESVPVAIIRGYEYEKGEEHVADIFRSAENDLFR
ncbi:MAG: coenzyme F420-0:L-glutamate ligase [Candidatus Thorarchaeota archaeon]